MNFSERLKGRETSPLQRQTIEREFACILNANSFFIVGAVATFILTNTRVFTQCVNVDFSEYFSFVHILEDCFSEDKDLQVPICPKSPRKFQQ